MIANEKPELLEATKSLYQYNNEDTIRYQCYAREDYKKMMNTIRRTEKEQAEQIEELTYQNTDLTSQIAEQSAYIKELEAKLAEMKK